MDMSETTKRNRKIIMGICVVLAIVASFIWAKVYLQHKEQEQVRQQRQIEEQKRLVAEQKEAERQAERAKEEAEAKKVEEAKQAEEAKKAEEATKAEEAKVAEEAKKVAEAKAAEEAKKAEEARRAEAASMDGDYNAALGGEDKDGSGIYSDYGQGEPRVRENVGVVHRFEISDSGITLWGKMHRNGTNGEELVKLDGTYFEFADNCILEETYGPDTVIIDKSEITSPFVGKTTAEGVPFYHYEEGMSVTVKNGKATRIHFFGA